MAIKAGLRTLLLANGSITALCPSQTIKGISRGSVFVGTIPQGAKPPFIVISRIGNNPMKSLDGTSGMESTEIDVDCYENTEPEVEALATVVKNYLKDYSGAAGSDVIDAMLLNDISDFENPEQNGNDTWRYAVTLSFEIQHH